MCLQAFKVPCSNFKCLFFSNEGNRFLFLRSKSPHLKSLYQIWTLDWTKQLVLTAFPYIIGRTQKGFPISSVQRAASILYRQTSPKFVCPVEAACFWAACCPVSGVLQTRQRRENLDKFVNWRFCKKKYIIQEMEKKGEKLTCKLI